MLAKKYKMKCEENCRNLFLRLLAIVIVNGMNQLSGFNIHVHHFILHARSPVPAINGVHSGAQASKGRRQQSKLANIDKGKYRNSDKKKTTIQVKQQQVKHLKEHNHN